MRDKDIDGMCRILSDIANKLIATKSKSERASPSEVIKEKMLSCNSEIGVIVTDSVAEAIKICKEETGEEDLVLITGSLYVVAEAMEELSTMSTIVGEV